MGNFIGNSCARGPVLSGSDFGKGPNKSDFSVSAAHRDSWAWCKGGSSARCLIIGCRSTSWARCKGGSSARSLIIDEHLKSLKWRIAKSWTCILQKDGKLRAAQGCRVHNESNVREHFLSSRSCGIAQPGFWHIAEIGYCFYEPCQYQYQNNIIWLLLFIFSIDQTFK